jgi:hypothetical protein
MVSSLPERRASENECRLRVAMEHSADVGFVGLTFDAEPARPLPVRGSQRRAGRPDEDRRGASDLRPA